jgi:hypothetical protein
VFEWKKQSHAFIDLAILAVGQKNGLSGTSGQLPAKVRGSECSWDLFRTLGKTVEPALGRNFTPVSSWCFPTFKPTNYNV